MKILFQIRLELLSVVSVNLPCLSVDAVSLKSLNRITRVDTSELLITTQTHE